MNLFHRLAIGGALSLLAESAAAIGAVASQPQSDNITFAPARSAEEPAVTACYWFDQQDDRYPLAPGVSMIDTGMLPAGFHALHAQIMGDGIPTSIETSWFVKTFSLSPDQTYTINIYIDGSLYTSMTTQADEDGIMNFNIDVNDLPLGMHTIMGQVIAPDGVPTSLAQSTFVRVPSEAQLGDGIACYWFDQQQERHPLSPGVNLIDTGSLPAGFHAVHAQIVSNGIPTSIETAWFMKTFQLTPGQAYTTNIYIDGSLYTSMSTPIGEDGTMSLSVDVNDLPVGIHSIMGQVISPEGVPTSLAQGTFLRVPTEAQLGNGTAFYWFDQQEERYPLSPGVNLIDTGSLPAGFHAVHAQISCDGMPTSIETAWFIKALNLSTDQEYTTNIYIDGSLYATETAQAGEDGTMSLNIDVSSLPVGMHTIMGQVISREGVPTSLAVGAFLRVPMDTQSDRLKLFYLIDGIQSGEVPDIRPGEVYSLDIDVASLPTGVHSISSFLAGANGLATAVETAWFVKIPVGGEGVKRYRYWLNENPSTMREVVLDKVTDPTEIVSMIDMPLEPFCSLRYEFAVEDGKPAVYAQNDYQMLFIDLGGRFTMGSGRYTDVRVRQDVTPAGVIPDNALTKVEGLGENEIRFYTFPGYAGDSISVSLNGKAMCEVYSPRGNTLIALDGTETEKGPMIRLTEDGTYYIAVHDISASGNSVSIDFRHITTHDPGLKAGDDFEYQGITYTVIDAEAKTCRTKDGSADNPGNASSGDLVIPQTASDGKDEYTVTGIGSRGFYNCDGLKSVTLPAALQTIGDEAFGNCNAIDTVSYAATKPVVASDNVFSAAVYETAMLKMRNATVADIRATKPWNLFKYATASDGSIAPSLTGGEEFEHDGIVYTVIDADAKTCKTKDGSYIEDPEHPGAYIYVSGNTYEGDLVIHDKVSDGIDEYTVTEIGSAGFYDCDGITSVSLPATLATVGYLAFYDCEGILSLDMPDSVTKIGHHAFYNCDGIYTLDLPNSVTTIEECAFADCSNLVSLNLPENLADVGERVFYHCTSLTSVELPASLTTVGRGMFYQCSSLASVLFPGTLSKIDSEAFAACSNLKEVDLPEGLTNIEQSAFFGCSGLVNLVMPESVTYIGRQAFKDCSALTSVTLPASLQFTGEKTFENCNAIVTVIYAAAHPLAASDDTFSRFVYDNAMLEMPNAIVADIKATKPWNLFKYATASDGSIAPSLTGGEEFEHYGIVYTVIDAAAKTCKTKDGDRIKDPDNPGEYIDAPGNTFEGDLIIPEKVTDGVDEYTVTEIGSAGFYDCDGITSVSLPSTLLSIGEKGFADCDGISSLDLPNSITTIDSYAFMGCPNLGSVNLPDNLANVGEGAFRSCRSLTSVTLPESLATVSSGMFYGCSSLSSVQFPSSLRKIDAEAFGYCGNIQEAVLPDGLTAIAQGAFYGCSGLVNLVMPESLDYIGVNAFCGCSSLQSLNLPDNLKDIDDEAFRNCTALTSVTLPAYMQRIGQQAFANSNAIVKVNYGAVHPIVASENIFSGAVYETATLDMPNATLADIRATMPWSRFGYIVAKDGTVTPPLNAGEEFEYEGITYTVVDPESKTCRTKDGSATDPGNDSTGDLVIPQTASDGNGDKYTVTGIGSRGFYNCGGLTSVTLPASLQTIGDEAFGNCNAIDTVSYAAAMPVEASDNVFSAAVYETATLKMRNATLADIRATMPWSLFGYIVAKDGTVTPSLNAGEEFEFEGITYTVVDPEAKTCRTKDGSATDPGNASTGDLVIPQTASDGKDDYTVIGIGSRGFYNCGGLTSVTLPASLQTIGDRAFGNCNAIATVSYAATMPVVASDNVFSAAVYETATLKMPNATLADIQATLPWSRFGNIEATDGTVTPSLKAGEDFEYEQITYTVVDPESKTCRTKDGSATNPGNDSSGDLVIPQTASDGKDNYTVIGIGSRGFYNCGGLTSVTLPTSLLTIGDEAFGNCNAIDTVSYAATMPVEASDNVFSEVAYETAKLKMPNATLADIRVTLPWSLFGNIVAKDGTVTPPLNAGEDFKDGDITYTVVDSESRTCRTKDGTPGNPGNECADDLVIPQTVSDGNNGYTVVGIGAYGFYGSGYLTSVTLPESVEAIGDEAFAGCQRLTSVVWTAQSRMPESMTDAIANPNLLVYVTDKQYAPAGMSDNVVVMDMETGTAECQRLVLQPGYPFRAVRTFDALYSTMTKEFTQITPIGGCEGWETIVLPFDATSVAVNDARGELTPFALILPDVDISTLYPYWLYEATTGSESGNGSKNDWTAATEIKAGVPYLIAMPNSPDYAARYRIDGPVTFSNPGRTTITPETTAPYAVTWASGRRFRPLWLPLDATEADDAMGLNVGMDNLTDDEGHQLAPGSAFHVDVEPRPLEAYVTRIDARRSLPVMGGQSSLPYMTADGGLTVKVENGTIYVSSSSDRRIELYCVDGLRLGSFDVKGGEPLKINGLIKGVYIVAGQKVIIK